MRRRTGPIFWETRPATIIKSAWRGDARKISIPHRARSYSAAPAAIISIAQQARPNVAGHIEFFLAQATALPTVVSRTPRRASSSTSWADPPRAEPGRRCTGTASGPLCDGLPDGPVARAPLHDRRKHGVGTGLDPPPDPLPALPLEPAFLPDVEIGDEHQADEHDHLHE